MKLYPYQQALWDKLNQGGFKHGEMTLFTAGRQTGKSTLNQYLNQWFSMQEQQQPKYKIISSSEVDGKTWYTIACRKDVSMWIRENSIENDSWYEHIDTKWTLHRNMFDISEELYMMVVLRFGK
jgi:ABC-type phosphate transport system ATPase subunit